MKISNCFTSQDKLDQNHPEILMDNPGIKMFKIPRSARMFNSNIVRLKLSVKCLKSLGWPLCLIAP